MSARLDLLRPFLNSYARDFSVFDFGSGVEYQSVGAEIAREYANAVVVCAEKDGIRYEPRGRMVLLRREFSVEDVETLARCEYFDLTLGLNILHWTGSEWLKMLRALRRTAGTLIVQVPTEVDTNAPGGEYRTCILDALAVLGRKLGETVQFPCHAPRPIFEIPGTGGILTQNDACSPERARMTVAADHAREEIQIHHARRREKYIPGLTLTTFRALGGAVPDPPALAKMIREMKLAGRHGDLQPWNIRTDGKECFPIDPAGNDWGGRDDLMIEAAARWAEGGTQC